LVSFEQPPPQLSPDGKFYWDGQRWVPMQTAVASQRRGMPCVTRTGCMIIFVVLLVIIVAAGIGTAISHGSG